VLRDLLLPLVFRFLVTDKSQAWIYDHHVDWDGSAAPQPSQPGRIRPDS
jgi:hypothetical protein